ncbi:MAG: hypothetical protein JWO60_192 [Frankiales bacterium]|nr:hypothetical protein [Frankiales bacterium]
MDSVLEVTAGGHAPAVPDQVVVGLGVNVVDANVGLAVSRASQAVEQLVSAVEQAGVPAADRQTVGLSVQENYGANGPDGFIASYQLRVVVTDLVVAGQLVQSAAEQVGDALRVHNVALGVADREPAEATARAEAVRAARRHAEQLAAAAGAVLGRLLELREGGDVPHLAYTAQTRSRSAGMPMEGGNIDSVVVVTATWQLLT